MSEVEPAGERDAPSVDAEGRPRASLEGVITRPAKLHVDHRGNLMELVNFSDPFWEEPVVHAYAITVAPGHIKGWGMHRVQADRYVAISGLLRVVLYDGREDSPSFQQFAEFWFSSEAPGFLRIPPGVWHADQNAGSEPCRVLNFPTHAYDPEAPDKYRIDAASGEIPFDFTLRDG
jgi:dTDP-4-dehydrorhamnose 3,5-epimerase